MTTLRVWNLLVVVWCAACGGSAIADKRLTSLDDSDIKELCESLTALDGDPRRVECSGGFAIMAGDKTMDECFAETLTLQWKFPLCEATVADSEACTEAIAWVIDNGAACRGERPMATECAPLLTPECVGGK